MSALNIVRWWIWKRIPVVKALKKDNYRAFSTSQRCLHIEKDPKDGRQRRNKYLIESSIALLTGVGILMLFCWEKKSVHAANGRKKVLLPRTQKVHPPKDEEDQTHPTRSDIRLGRQIKREVNLRIVEENGDWVPPASNKKIKNNMKELIEQIGPQHLGRAAGTLVPNSNRPSVYRIDNQGSFERHGEKYDNIQGQVHKKTHAMVGIPSDQVGKEAADLLQEALNRSLTQERKVFIDKES